MNREEYNVRQAAARERYKMLPHLKDVCLNCRMCELGWRKLTKNNKQYDPHVFSNWGPVENPALFMVIGQNPGSNEVLNCQPFVGAAGANFDKALFKMWSREQVYISNCVKCYTEGNTPPTAQQLERCEPILRMELAIVKPVLVIALGSIAFKCLGGDDFQGNIGKIHTSEKFGVKVFTTYHPSPLNLADAARRVQFERDMGHLRQIMDQYLLPF